MNLTTIIITKNEESNIVDAIESVKFSGQIIVVDNVSKDRTVELAKRNGVEVASKKFDSFSKQREFVLKEVKSDWILYIDADERVTEELKEEIEKVILNKDSKDAYKLKRRNYYYGDHEWYFHENMERLFRRDSLKGWSGEIHESPV